MIGGQPTLEGHRLTVSNIVTGLNKEGLDPYTKDHEISEKDARVASEYCMNRECLKAAGEFCEHCVLSDPNDIELDKGWEIASNVYTKYWKR